MDKDVRERLTKLDTDITYLSACHQRLATSHEEAVELVNLITFSLKETQDIVSTVAESYTEANTYQAEINIALTDGLVRSRRWNWFLTGIAVVALVVACL